MVRLCLVLFVVGCAGTPDVELDVQRAFEASTAGRLRPATGNMFVVVEVAVTNHLQAPAPIAPDHYDLRTASGDVPVSPRTADLGAACPMTPLLTEETTGCRLGFEISRDNAPKGLRYAGTVDGKSVETSVSFDFERCSRCGEECVDFQTSTSHCGACGVVVPSGGQCVMGVPTCGDNAVDCNGTCMARSACSFYRTSPVRISCTELCSYEHLDCQMKNGLPIHAYFGGLVGAACGDVPAAEVQGNKFEEIRCQCGL